MGAAAFFFHHLLMNLLVAQVSDRSGMFDYSRSTLLIWLRQVGTMNL